MRRSSVLVAFAATLATLSSTAALAQQQARVQVGVLECKGGPTVGLVLGSVNTLSCTLRNGNQILDNYTATVRKVGLDVGFTSDTSLAWAVFAPTGQIGRGDLSGNYGGADASATVGLGLGANALVGGSANSFALQPLSLQGQTGLNAAAGLEGVELRPR